ncbi:hypothetical protein L226DRAFT_467328 [Lentinus tigrinus ALCF2SS1-7]|uniref:uncharacterized protein n=1 Tax=Lentinus tigrinus ALCF2SS1-7 TaxID=1328758 RepID=UPI0011661783|nr:hypothetical protein L226DRAFT_467328 [Lentinus tigrinus ALCF2SS1-7]
MFVYLAWPQENWIVQSALDEAGIKYFEVNGKAEAKARTKLLDRFRASKDMFVCLLSNVGMVGLNLAFANIMIIVDNLWSQQEYDQLIGRVWRHGQRKEVIAYYLITKDTSDVFFSNVSLDKGYMHMVLTAKSGALSKWRRLTDYTVY